LHNCAPRFAEVSALAILPAYRSKGVTLMLYSMLLRLAQRRQIKNLAIAVRPRMELFFKVVFLFERLGAVQLYKRLNNTPSLALNLDLQAAVKGFKKFKNRPLMNAKNGQFNVYDLFCEEDLPQLPALAGRRFA
jgi:ribosomal protein S18 acetylase RimI-like enzyme